MRGMRLVLAAAALCLAVIAPLAAPAYAWGGTGTYACPNRYPCANAYPYQYANRYPYAPQYGYRNPYPNQYGNRYPYAQPYVYRNPYPYQYVAPAPPPPPPPPYLYPPPQPPYYPPVYAVPGGVSTYYGNYAPCQQYGLHQASCFMADSSNSPNLGSIQMEPGITIWGNCNAGDTMSQSGTNYQCSKTGAGWFPR